MKKTILNPMYLYRFLLEIAPLSVKEVPDPVKLRGKNFIYDCVERSLAEKYCSVPAKGEYFLLYASVENSTKLLCKDVTLQMRYLDKIRVKSFPVLPEEHELIRLNAAIFEAMYLFRQLQVLNLPYIFAPWGDFEAFRAVYSDNSLKNGKIPVLARFGGISLNLEIFVAQTKFFFAKYFSCAFAGNKTVPANEEILSVFDDLVYQELMKLGDGCCRKVKNFTDVDNPDFDDFIQQLELTFVLPEVKTGKNDAEKFLKTEP